MSEIKPNHICKNANCHKGTDGGRKHYYACNLCDKRFNWRSVGCSMECYTEYQKQVLDARAKGKVVDLLPERTDMTTSEFKETVLNKDEKEIAVETLSELSDNGEVLDNDNLLAAIDNINSKLDKKQIKTRNVNSKTNKTDQ